MTEKGMGGREASTQKAQLEALANPELVDWQENKRHGSS